MSETTCIPPITFKRNEYGLLENVNYVFNEDGRVNWRKMIKPEHLYVNKNKFESRGLPTPTSIEGVADEDLVIKLSGIKELAQLRGYSSVNHKVITSKENFASVVCEIVWKKNYETENVEVSFMDGADAHPMNTNGFGANFLTTIAINRAFVRAVRNFLQINIVGQEELGSASQVTEEVSAPSSTPEGLLLQAVAAQGKTYKDLRNRMKKEGLGDFEKPSDIPKMMILTLIEKINNNEKSLKD